MYDLWSLCLLFFFIYNVIADNKDQNLDDFDEIQVEGYKSHSDIKTKWQFLNRHSLPIEQAPFIKPALSPSKFFYKIPIAQSSSILLSLRNLGETTFNITTIQGYLHAAHRFSFYVQNNTAREINSLLRPNSELTLEYRFNPWKGLPTVDYVFSCDVEYHIEIDQETESKRLPIEYKYKFINTTVNVYDSNPMGYLDFQLLFMTISIIIFWCFMGILFYEFWWIPNQEAQGKQPLPTVEFIQFVYDEYIQYYVNMWKQKTSKQSGSINGKYDRKGTENGKKRQNNTKNPANSWLSGTAAGSKKKKKKKY